MKKIYYISYEKQPFDKTLDKTIKDMGAWFSYFDNNWLVETSLTTKEIYNRLQNQNSEFRILVLEVTVKSYWGWLDNEAWNWLRERLNK